MLAEGRSIESIARETGQRGVDRRVLGQQARPAPRSMPPGTRRAAGSSASNSQALRRRRAVAPRDRESSRRVVHDRPALAGRGSNSRRRARAASPRRRLPGLPARDHRGQLPGARPHDVRPARELTDSAAACAERVPCIAGAAMSSASWSRRRAGPACCAGSTDRSAGLHFHHRRSGRRSPLRSRARESRARLPRPARRRGSACCCARTATRKSRPGLRICPRRYYYEARPFTGPAFGGSSIGRAFGC